MIKFIKWLFSGGNSADKQKSPAAKNLAVINKASIRIPYPKEITLDLEEQDLPVFSNIWNQRIPLNRIKFKANIFVELQQKDGSKKSLAINGNIARDENGDDFKIAIKQLLNHILRRNNIDPLLLKLSDNQLNTYWVLPEKLMAGESFYIPEKAKAEKAYRYLVDHGIDTIITLQEKQEFEKIEISRKFEEPIDQYFFPIKDYGIPSKELTINLLDTIDQNLKEGKKVYVHCKGGIGRTGLVVGCYLIRHGLATAETVLQEVTTLKEGQVNLDFPSPENQAQVVFLKNWQKGQ